MSASAATAGEAAGLDRRRLADQVYELLRTRVLRGEIRPGAHLSVPRLAEELGLSRSPVREAVQRLVAEGLGVEHAHRGAVVARIDPAELDELIDLRRLVEGYAARRAAQAGDRDALAGGLEAALARHRAAIEADDRAGIVSADMDFHAGLAHGAGEPTLRVVLPLLGRAQLLMVAGDLGHWPRMACAEHAAVLEAVRSGDPDAAEAAARDHLERVRQRHRNRQSGG